MLCILCFQVLKIFAVCILVRIKWKILNKIKDGKMVYAKTVKRGDTASIVI